MNKQKDSSDDSLPGMVDNEYGRLKLKQKEKLNLKNLENRRNAPKISSRTDFRVSHISNFGFDYQNFLDPISYDNTPKNNEPRVKSIVVESREKEKYPIENSPISKSKKWHYNKRESFENKEDFRDRIDDQYDANNKVDLLNEEILIEDADSSEDELQTSRIYDTRTKKKVADPPLTDKIGEESNYEDHSSRSPNVSTIYESIHENLEGFVFRPIVQHTVLKCRITREKGSTRGIYPTYFMYLERDDGRKMLLLVARKRVKTKTANYLISTQPNSIKRNNENIIGKLKSNMIGTNFTLYDYGINPAKARGNDQIRQEYLSVIYESNILGMKGPRKFSVIVPGMLTDDQITELRPSSDKETILEKWKRNDSNELVQLINKKPEWDDKVQAYGLDYFGRPIKPSVKNFQIIHPNEPNYIIMQFGKIEDDYFICDFRYPLCPFQAFGIALTSFNSKLVVE